MNKKFIALLILSAGVSAANATLLITATEQPGFVMNPQGKTFELDSSGIMTMTVLDFATHKTTVTILGKLSKATVGKISADINAIAPTAQLMDKDSGQPLCTDTPSFSVHVQKIVNGSSHDIEVMREGACHSWSLDTRGGQSEADLALAFLKF